MKKSDKFNFYFLVASAVAMVIIIFVLRCLIIGDYIFINDLIFGGNNNIAEPQSVEISTSEEIGNNETVSLLFGGDVMLGRYVAKESLENKLMHKYPFEKIEPITQAVDLFMINLELPIVERCNFHPGFKLCTSPGLAEALVDGGVDIVNLANNHTSDYGPDGLSKTVGHLNNMNILSTGLNKLTVSEIKGIKFGFLGFDFSTQNINNRDLELVSQSSDKVDFLVVNIHWGKEYTKTANTKQKKIARQITQKGADLIIGHGPHWVQNWEYLNNQPVFYSLGNLIFDMMWDKRVREGYLVKVSINDTVITKIQVFSTYMKNIGQPIIAL